MPTSETIQGRPTLCVIDLSALRWNLRQVKAKVGSEVRTLCMVKADAYGHGALQVAQALAHEGSDSFGVATLEEAAALRRSGIREPILVVAGAYPEQLSQIIEHRLTMAVHDLEAAARLDGAARNQGARLGVHIKVDTGMGRLGFLAHEIEAWLPPLKKLQALEIAGVFSHFSQAESVEGDYTRGQLRKFHEVVSRLRAHGITPPLTHLANSAATITLPEAHFDMVRPGIMLYGAYPAPEMKRQVELKPALSWKTRIMQLKNVPTGTSISYGQTFVTKRESLIATLPVGYADGYQRLLSNCGQTLVRGKRAPVAGRVCMDLTMIDVTDITNVQPGDEVVLLGGQDGGEITADEMAGWANTISYEIFTSISARVPRIYINS
jgi:alanine racemase